ncbi:MAG: hypothetical protein GQ523_00275 [Methanophagales archaeon]|jgi:hypothetical protein|nr:hypothetical protein [Methanophagales archaeon]
MADKHLKGSIKVKSTLGVSVTASVKTNFSSHHMLSAAHFARQSAIIEKNYKDGITDELRAEHRAYVTGAIIVSVASLEATINDVFISAIDNDNLFKDFDPSIPKVLSEFWTWDVVERSSILEKYRCVLAVANKEAFDHGNPPYQEVNDLIKLRNALVHYKPEWDTDLKNHKGIENRLKSRFNINPFSHDNDAFFPKKCLGHGCAEWSVQSVIKFIEDFYNRIGFPPKWSKH